VGFVVTGKYYREPGGETFPQMEDEILRSWEDQGILSKVKARMASGEPFVFCEGPPTANARPHMGHAHTRAVKDAFLRYHVMNGRRIVPYIGGWDCHGLPVELEIEKSLGIKTKRDIESLGIGEFNALCRESVLKYKRDWEEMSRRIGYWIDYDNAYMTMSNEYIESVWWSLKQLHSKGLLSKGHKVVAYCSRCGTTLSTHEVALGFRETEDRFVVVKFKVEEMGASLMVRSTTPWALVANALLAVDQEQEYLMVEDSGEKLVIASSRAPSLLPGAKIIGRVSGRELVGKRYEPPFNYNNLGGKAFKVVNAPDALDEDGTGIVSISPAYGTADYEVGLKEGLPIFDPVGMDGRFTTAVQELAGRFAKDADSEVMRILEAKKLLLLWGVMRHSYPFCWRCDTPLIYKALDSWFVRTSQFKQRMTELNEEVRWVPDTFKHGRFGNFLLDVKDWAISRSRYWGTPLPIWRCAKGHEVCVGSVDELRGLSATLLPTELDLHRPAVDSLELTCPECSGKMSREEFVIDCWYDSGCAPFAQYHYPFENIAEFDTHRSVDFIAEGVDQTRGWFYTQLALGTILFDKPAFRSVLVLGLVLDEKGVKMTRESANLVFPDDVFSSVGADASRLFLLGSPVWQSIEFSKEKVREEMVSVLTTMLNVYTFFASNANVYGFRQQKEYSPTHDLDRWIISRLNSTIAEAREGFDELEVHEAVKAIDAFIVDLSNWYVRRSRRRFWEENDPQDRFSAHCTLYECLLTLSKTMAPITPFFSDWLYRNLKGPKESVHLEDFPLASEEKISGTLERQMAVVMTSVEAGRLARQKVNAKLRQPLPGIVIVADSDKAWMLRRYEKMIAEELNVKKVECLESRDKMVQYAVRPNLKTLGPKYKDGAAEIAKLLSKVDENELVKHLRTNVKLRLGGFDLSEEDVIVTEKEKPGYSHANVGEIHVYVALEVTQNLKLEGLAREVIRRVQRMRKDQKLQFEEPVVVEYSGHPDIELAISSHKSHIMHEVHAKDIVKRSPVEGAVKWTVNKLPLELAVRKSSP
jgi:isoleucyl-tRNA synthetase